jgi:predicted ferric reductase
MFTNFAATATDRIAHNWPWYVVRGAGFTAAGLLILLMISGIGHVTGLTYRFIEPIKAWAIHKALAFALCASIVVHIVFLLIDKFLPFSLLQILVPFTSGYTNKVPLLGVSLGVVATGLGVLAMYGVALIVASSLGWINTKKRAWRWLHYLSYFVMLAVFVHALAVGSDLKYGSFRLIWLLIGGVLLLAVVSRLWRAGTMRRKNIKADDTPTPPRH